MSSGLEVVTAVEPDDQGLTAESVGGEVVLSVGAVVASVGESTMVAGVDEGAGGAAAVVAWLGSVVL